jgi:RNA polymerase-binding transcription factor DksA
MTHTLSGQELRAIRSELQRERVRFAATDPRQLAYTAALARLADGSYGSCRNCGGAIPYERLIAIPETPYCVGCGAGSVMNRVAVVEASAPT